MSLLQLKISSASRMLYQRGFPDPRLVHLDTTANACVLPGGEAAVVGILLSHTYYYNKILKTCSDHRLPPSSIPPRVTWKILANMEGIKKTFAQCKKEGRVRILKASIDAACTLPHVFTVICTDVLDRRPS